MCCGTSDIGLTCLPLSMMNNGLTCLAVNVLWHKWHWNDLSSTLHDDHLCAWKNNKYFSSTCCKSWLAVNVLWHKWHWNYLSSTLHDEHLYGWKILHRTFQFPDIINFITTRCQQLFAKHLLLNITLFYALLHSFFKFLPSKLLKNRTRACVPGPRDDGVYLKCSLDNNKNKYS